MRESHRFDFGSNDTDQAATWSSKGEKDYRSTLVRIKKAAALAMETPVWAEDLLRVVRAAHLLDRQISRDDADDGWSRQIELRVQVSDSALWDSALPVMERLLSVLTSDSWQLSTRSGAPPIDSASRLVDGWVADSVALFSGGLDSSAYAAHHLGKYPGKLLLISHDQANAQVPQRDLYDHLTGLTTEPNRLCRKPMSQEARAKGRRLESSTRSRGLGFMATAVFAAAAHRVGRVMVPENGQLAINPPLTPARLGACSTRSVHPLVLNLLNEVIRHIGGNVTVENPFLHFSKGDVCRVGIAAGLTPQALAQTVSCGSHTVQRGFGNCGYCFPCLIRRSGLQSALGQDPTEYHHELSGLEGPSRVHVRDLHAWVTKEFTARDLLSDLPLPPSLSVATALDVIERGRGEILRMLRTSLAPAE